MTEQNLKNSRNRMKYKSEIDPCKARDGGAARCRRADLAESAAADGGTADPGGGVAAVFPRYAMVNEFETSA